jgi:hypothetical protein
MSGSDGHRAVIAAAVTAMLRESIPEVSGRVFHARTWPLQETDHPALLVYGWQEEKTAISLSTWSAQYAVRLVLAVEVRVLDRSRDGNSEGLGERQQNEVEAELEALSNAVCETVMKSRRMLGAGGLVERIEGVKTTLGINTRDSEMALGRALIAFDLRFTEQYDLTDPVIECDDAELVLHITPDPSAL